MKLTRNILETLVQRGYMVEVVKPFLGCPAGSIGRIVDATRDNMIRVKWDNGTADDWFSWSSKDLIKVLPRDTNRPGRLPYGSGPLEPVFID